MVVKVTKITQITIQKTVIHLEHFLQVEDAIIIKNKMLEKIMVSGDKKHILLTSQTPFCAVLFVSPFITGPMTTQIK